MDADRCIVCNAAIQIGQQICQDCLKKYSEDGWIPADAEEAVELRSIADILSITANTDRNIKKSMEAILNIADRLERKKSAKYR